MKRTYALVLPALAAIVNAQTAPDFPVQVEANLRVDFLNSSTRVQPAGLLLPREDVLFEPTVYGPEGAIEEATYVLFMIDQDVNTGNGPKVELLHWFQPNLVGVADALIVVPSAENGTNIVGAVYLTPTPPGGDGAHRYNLLLYPQPENFAVPDAYAPFAEPVDVNARYPFNMSGFAEAAGLGRPVAANWFRVVNETEPDTGSSTSTVSATSTASGSEGTTTAAASTSDSPGAAASSASSASAIASASSAADSAAGLVEVGGSMKELVVGLVMGVAGAWLWML